MSPQNNDQSRRTFLRNSLITGSLFPLMRGDLSSLFQPGAISPLKIYIFSKHLQFLNYKDMTEAAAEMGFDGIDLTVRSDGHVLPERVESDLPKVIEAMHKVGFLPMMMVTSVEDADNSIDKKLLETAAKMGFQYYRMSWYKYPQEKGIPESLQYFQQKLKNLSYLNKELGLTGCYQNHSGNLAGSAIWDLWELLKEADKQYTGLQYDIRHAVVEGGLSWQTALRLIQPQIKTLAFKDFTWEKKNGQWNAAGTPMGEGMVDFKTYFKLLKQYQVNTPVSLHMEYPLGGAENGDVKLTCDKKVVFDAMKRDLKKVRELWQQV